MPRTIPPLEEGRGEEGERGGGGSESEQGERGRGERDSVRTNYMYMDCSD